MKRVQFIRFQPSNKVSWSTFLRRIARSEVWHGIFLQECHALAIGRVSVTHVRPQVCELQSLSRTRFAVFGCGSFQELSASGYPASLGGHKGQRGVKGTGSGFLTSQDRSRRAQRAGNGQYPSRFCYNADVSKIAANGLLALSTACEGVFTMIAKCTMFFSLGNGGWSETWYRDNDTLTAAMVQLQALLTYRLGFLVSVATCTGLRVSFLSNPAVVQTQSRSDVGSIASTRDVKNVALFLPLGASNNTRRTAIFKGMSDASFDGGVYVAPPIVDPAIVRFIQQLRDGAWCILTQDKVNFPLRAVNTVDATGLVTTFDDPVWTVPVPGPLKIKFFRTKDSLGKGVKGVFSVIPSLTNPLHFQITNWTGQIITGKANARKYVLVLATSLYNLNRAFGGSRKTGRPFGSPVGRVKAKK